LDVLDPSHWGLSEWVTAITGLLAVLGAVYGCTRFLLRNIWTVEDRRRRELLSAFATLVVAGAAGGILLEFWRRSQPPPSAPPTLTFRFTYGTEKDAWITAAIARFHATSPRLSNGWTIRVAPDARGSILTADEISRGGLDTDAWCPASSVELAQLRGALETDSTHTALSFVSDEPVSLATSYLALLSLWPERTRLLRQALGKIDWDTLHTAYTATGGWTTFGGQASWGGVKFGHTKPTTSNSGLMTLITLAAWQARAMGEAIPPMASVTRDPRLQAFLWVYEDAVRQFGQSTGSFTGCVLSAYAASHDLIVTYESDILANAGSHTQPIELFYPSLTMICDHPFAIFARQHDPDTALKQEAARRFRAFLLEDAQQREARSYGFRPINPALPLSSSIPGFLSDVASHVAVMPSPTRETLLALQTAWTTRYGDPTVSPGC
jgi:ABC-type molybdate transport system substrate-binding protein